MKNLLPIYNVAIDSIDKINNEELSEKLIQLNCSNIKTLPNWIYQTMVKPQPIIPNANVERLSIHIKGSRNAFIDIHEIEGFVRYVKIFFLFGIAQFIKNSYYKKNIDTLMHENFGQPNMQSSFKIRLVIGKNCLVYTPGDAVVVTNHSIIFTQKEFQIHIYEPALFDLTMFPI